MVTIKQGENFMLRLDINDVETVGIPLTSGLLVIGLIYQIVTYVAGDDFINVGAASNAATVQFIATGTTPTNWTNGSTLQQITKVAIPAAEITDFQVVAHQLDKQLNVWKLPNTAFQVTDGLVKLEVVSTITNKWLGAIQFKVMPSFTEPDYFLSGAQTDVVCFDDLLTVESC
jgi:hypothetical protein